MKILIVHNRYSARGGEERVVALQSELLTQAGHTVVCYERAYDEIRHWRFGRLTALCSSFYNRRAVVEIKQLIARERPEVALVHNLFPVVSPAVLPVLHRAGVRVVQIVHNYRLGCPTGLAFRAGAACALCPQKSKLQCARHRCEGSWLGSVAFALRSVWAGPKYKKNVDCYCAVSQHVRSTLIGWGVVEAAQTVVVPNPVCLPLEVRGIEGRTGVLFVGRFTPEKGAHLLLEIARQLPEVPFTVTGEAQIAPPNVRFVGVVERAELDTLYGSARVVVCPSGVAETFGLSAAEGMAAGAVAVVSDRGALPELVEAGAGVCVSADDPKQWVETIRQLTLDDTLWTQYAQKGRSRIAERYAAQGYVERLDRQVELVAQDE